MFFLASFTFYAAVSLHAINSSTHATNNSKLTMRMIEKLHMVFSLAVLFIYFDSFFVFFFFGQFSEPNFLACR